MSYRLNKIIRNERITEMKLFNRIVAVFIAAVMTVSAFSVGAAAAPASDTEESTEVSLGSGALCGGYSTAMSYITKDSVFALAVYTYIPINNIENLIDKYDIDERDIFCIANANDSISTDSYYTNTISTGVYGGFFRVETEFCGLVYKGKGNQFDYTICYISQGASVSVSLSVAISECVESTVEEEITPVFILNSYTKDAVKAGTTATINVNMRKNNDGLFKNITAMLTSSDGCVIVEDIGEKISYSTSPSFDFKINVPATTPAGIYNLTLAMNVYNEKGKVATTASYTIPVKVTSDIKSAGLSVSSYKISRDTVKNGDKFALTLTLENNCGIDLSNIGVSLEGLVPAKFVLDGGFSEQTVSIKNGKKGDVRFNLVACAGIDSIREVIDIKATYRTIPAEASSEQSLSTSVIVVCQPSENAAAGKYDITMTEYKVSSQSVAEKTKFDVSVTLKNTSKNKITNARVSLLNLDGTKFAVNSGLTYADFELESGRTKTFTFSVIGCAGIASIREVIPIEVSYGEITASFSATVSCVPSKEAAGGEPQEVFAPNIIISSYNYGGEYVLAGQQFPLKVTIENASSAAVIQNLKVTVNGASSGSDGTIAFSPANSSNSFFFDTLSTRSTTEIVLDLLAKSDAMPNSYPIMISFEYEYTANGKSYKANEITETITIPLQQEDRLSSTITEIPSDMVYTGQPFSVAASLVNKGKSGIYNLTVSVAGEGFVSDTTSEYIGNVESGTEEYFETQLTSMTDGEVSGEIVITYEDANGTEKEQRLPFAVSSMSMNMGFDDGGMGFDDGGMGFDDGGYIDGMPAEGGDMTWLWFVIGGGVVVIAGVIITICVVKHKKRAKAEEDEDEDI